MFKVGDRGKTRGGRDYIVTAISSHGLNYECYDGESGCDHGYTLRTADLDGSWSFGHMHSPYDLMPLDSHHYNTDAESGPDKEEVEMPEYLPEEIEAPAEYECEASKPSPSEMERVCELAHHYNVTIRFGVGDVWYEVYPNQERERT